MEVKTDENLEKDEVKKGDKVLENAENEAEKDAKPQKLKASEVYAEESYELQAQKSEEVFEETAKEVEPPFELTEWQQDENFKKENENLLLKKHIGKAFGNTSIALLSFILAIISGQFIFGAGAILLGLFLGLVLFIISIATIGLIYVGGGMAKWWGYVKMLFDGGSGIVDFLGKLYVSFPYILAVGLVFSIISIIATAKSGVYKSKARIVVSSIICGISVVLLIFLVAGGLSAK